MPLIRWDASLPSAPKPRRFGGQLFHGGWALVVSWLIAWTGRKYRWCLGRAFGELSHLIRHRETPPCFPGPGCLDGGIQGTADWSGRRF